MTDFTKGQKVFINGEISTIGTIKREWRNGWYLVDTDYGESIIYHDRLTAIHLVRYGTHRERPIRID